MFKTKIVEKIVRFELFLTVIGQLYVKWPIGRHSKTRFFQNWILRNTHTVTNRLIFTKLRNCAKLEFRKSGTGQFCAKWLLRMIAQIVVFFAQNWCAKKEKFCVSFHKNCAKVLQMENPIWKKIFQSLSRCEAAVYLLILVLDVGSWRTSAGLKILEILNQSTYSHLFFL